MRMPDLGADPTLGSPDGVGDIAATFRAHADAAARRAAHVRGAATTLAGTGSTAVDAVRAGIAVLEDKYTTSGEACDRIAVILEQYADAMADIRRRAEALREDAEAAWATLLARRADALEGGLDALLGWSLAWDHVMPAWLYPGDPSRLASWQYAIEEFDRARIDYARLAAERDHLDQRTRDRLLSVPFFVTLTGNWQIGERGAATAAGAWAGDPSAITAEGLASIDDPELVRTVWDTLTEDQQHALIAAGPALLGGLAGLPPWARVAANRITARDRAAEVRGILAREPHPYHPLSRDEIGKLQAELRYLNDAVAGRVQLYYYDHTTDSVIEMIGELGPHTTEINTYVPGTYTSALSVFRGEVQQVGRWFEGNGGGGVVTFVWKMGQFPGENEYNGGVSPVRILEANDEDFALRKGKEIAGFERELDAALGETVADRNAIGHSWGLAALTSAEVAGAHYDVVASLAGAGMPKAWEPDPTTRYEHFSYVDALSPGQALGLVWDGRNPGRDAAFTSHIFEDEADATLVIPMPVSEPDYLTPVPPVEIPINFNGIETHNRIASDDESNREALNRLKKRLQ